MAATKITVRNNGSVRIEGDFEICDPEGAVFDLGGRTTISLCRCGHSENKPFCDGAHKKAGFQSEIKARALPPVAPKPASV
ncbi:MAG TPA: CDGSH iron-sulfur domain-containing protein [Terriglobia bacterium]|nr:CDGSH iron-sulfur domain-containing protein [Terriglobia bacterium]